MSAEGVEPALRRYLDIWTRIDAQSVDRLRDVLSPDARFADPFHDVTGSDAVIAVLRRAYRRLHSVDITVDAVAVTGAVGFVRWHFAFVTARRRRPWAIEGMSEIHVDQRSGLVTAHIDHWDAARQIYEKLPGIGAILRVIRGRL